MWLNFILSLFAGLAAKLTDDLVDRPSKVNKKIKFIGGIAYGVVCGFLVTAGSEFATLFLAVFAAVLLARKIDDAAHFLAVAVAVIVVSLRGLSEVIFPFFVFFILFAFLDELLNDAFDKKTAKSGKKQGLFQKIEKKRLCLDIAALALSLALNNWVYFFAIASFDIGYNAAAFAGIIKSP